MYLNIPQLIIGVLFCLIGNTLTYIVIKVICKSCELYGLLCFREYMYPIACN